MIRNQWSGIVEEPGDLRPVRHPRIDVANPKFRSYVDLRPPILSYSRVVRYTPITINEEELILHYNVDSECFYLDTRGIEELFHAEHYSNYFGQQGATDIPLFRMKFIDGPHDKVDVLLVVSVGSGMQGSTAEGFNATLRAVMANLANLEESGKVKWDRVVLCIVVNGREEFERLERDGSTSVLGELEKMGVYHRPGELWEEDGEMEKAGRINLEDRLSYDEGLLTVDGGLPVHMHLYEATIMMLGGHFPPVRIALCVKESPDQGSAGALITSRLSCHLWAIMGVARHLSNMSTPSKFSSDGGGLPIILMDCGMCPADDCLSVMLARLSKPMVGVVSTDTCATGSLQLLGYPTVSSMLRNPSFCAWLFRQRLRLICDAAMETGLGGSLSMMEGSLCGFRLDALDLDRYFTILTKAGNCSQLGFMGVNMHISDGGTMLSSVTTGWKSELLANAKVVCPSLRRESVLRDVKKFSYKNLIESSRLDVSAIFQAMRRMSTAWERFRPFSRSSFLHALLLIYRFIDFCLSLVALVGMGFIILLGAEFFTVDGMVPLACVLLLYSVVMFQLCVGVGDLTPPVLFVFRTSSVFLGVLWSLGWIKLIYNLIYGQYYLILGAVIAVLFSYVWCILLYADLRFTFKILPLCILQWAFLYPTMSVLGSTIYSMSLSDVLPWGTPGPDPVDPRTAETLAIRMESRSWLVASISALNLVPIILYVVFIHRNEFSRMFLPDDDDDDDFNRLKLTPITNVVAWAIVGDALLRASVRIIGVTLYAIKRVYDSWSSQRNAVPRWLSDYSDTTAASPPSSSIPSFPRGLYSFYESERGIVLISSAGVLLSQPMQPYSKSILGLVGGRRAAEITATVDGAAMPDFPEDFSYPENEESKEDEVKVKNPVFVPCPRKRQASPLHDSILISRIQ